MTATMTSRTTAAFGTHGLTNGPAASPMSHGAAPPPGEFRTRSAKPAQTNDMARVTTMSGTLVMTTRPPLTAPRARPRSSTPTTTTMPNSSLWPCISEAAITLVSAIIEPIDRSMPPEMTTMAWATAASASGSTELPSPWTAATP